MKLLFFFCKLLTILYECSEVNDIKGTTQIVNK